ncbi:MAG: hypothetical protein MUC94_06390, partial [bacterium]|nr:hypothetical protein [bacterium]
MYLQEIAAFIAIVTTIISIISYGKKIKAWISQHIKPILLIFLILCIMVILCFIVYFIIPKKPIEPDNTRFNFESGTVGWQAQIYKDSRGIASVRQSKKRAFLGRYSLELKADLVGGDTAKHKGETYVELSEPENLENQRISLHYFLPCPSQAAGDLQHPNGLQVFVKDINFKSEYGRWINIKTTDTGWMRADFTPGYSEPVDGSMDF